MGWGGYAGLHSKVTEQINPGTVYTFALGKKQPMPTFPIGFEKKLIELPVTANDKEVAHGNALFSQYCRSCHNFNGGGTIPDPTFSTEETFNAFKDIVWNGAYLSKGMPKFGDRLSEQDVGDIKQFILSEAKKKREQTGTSNN